MLSRQLTACPSSTRLLPVRGSPAGIKSAASSLSRPRHVAVCAKLEEDLRDPPFSLDKAVVLGAAAFGAYTSPAETQGLVKQLVDGTNLRFFDTKYVQEAYDGVLEISKISAKLVSTSDWSSKTDAYIVAELDGAYARTSTLWNNENPDFDDTLDIWVPKGKGLGEIAIKVFDDDRWTNEDDSLGSATFRLNSLREESETVELQMHGNMSGDCVVTLTATFLPFGGTAGDKFLEGVAEADAPTDISAKTRGMEKAVSAIGKPVSQDLLEGWEKLCGLYQDNIFTDKGTIAYIDNESTGTQVWVSRDVGERKVIVSFRGTEPTNVNEKFADVFTDVDIRQTPMQLRENEELSGWSGFLNMGRLASFNRSGPEVHEGFYRSWTSVREVVLQTIDSCTGGEADWHVYTTGHSLGGALAILCAFELGQRKGSVEPCYPLTMYNFGGPRVGDQKFVEMYNVKDTWRVHNQNDIVAQIPIAGLMGYSHVDTGVCMMEDGSGFKFTDALNEEVEVQGGPGAKWSARNIITSIRDTYGDATELYSKQKEFYTALTSGEAVKEHLEDEYLEGLTDCVDDSEDSNEVNTTTEEARKCVARSREKVEAEAAVTQDY